MPLRILSLETSHLPGSASLAEGGDGPFAFRSNRTLPHRESTARHFAPCIREMLTDTGLQPSEIGLVAVGIGPGSFTGLRIAVTFAKTFAYASGADVLGVSCMDILAQQAADVLGAPQPRLWTLVDAHRGQIFTARYEIADNALPHQTLATQIMDVGRWFDQLERRDLVTGLIVDRLSPRLPASVDRVSPPDHMPSAQTLARIAYQRWQEGVRDDLWRLQPAYFRKSAAEERLDKAR